MKKISCLAVSLTVFAGLAQESKSVVFTKKLNYKIEASEMYNEGPEDFNNINYDHYLGKNNKESLLSFYYNDTAMARYGAGESNYFVTKNWMIPLTVSGISKTINYSVYSAFQILKEGQVVSKLNRIGTIGTTNCQYYAILRDIDDKESYDYCFCIDESNKTNNAETLFPDSKLKGLILSVEYNNENSYKLVYKTTENVSLELPIDNDKLSADIEEYQQNSLTNDVAVDTAYATTEAYPSDYNGLYSDPLYTYSYDGENLSDYNLYNYISPIYSVTINALYNTKEYGSEEATQTRDQVATFYKKESKSLVKNLKSAKLITADQTKELNKFFKAQNERIKKYVPTAEVATDYTETDIVEAYAVPDTAAYAEDYDYYTKYQSDYKNETIDEVVLAYDIDVKDNEKIKEYAPDYCDNLKSKIPNFQNESLSTHVHNLTGQICDLYLYNNGGNVGYFETINSMRKSYLEIEKLRSSLSQKDQKLLLEFIKNLD